jgi:uroporphyrinogen III methyltransferase/synthase
VDLPLYETIVEGARKDGLYLKEFNKIDYVTFTSVSTVEGFRQKFAGADWSGVKGICIGSQTYAAAQTLGIETFLCKQADIDSMLALIKENFKSGNHL